MSHVCLLEGVDDDDDEYHDREEEEEEEDEEEREKDDRGQAEKRQAARGGEDDDEDEANRHRKGGARRRLGRGHRVGDVATALATLAFERKRPRGAMAAVKRLIVRGSRGRGAEDKTRGDEDGSAVAARTRRTGIHEKEEDASFDWWSEDDSVVVVHSDVERRGSGSDGDASAPSWCATSSCDEDEGVDALDDKGSKATGITRRVATTMVPGVA